MNYTTENIDCAAFLLVRGKQLISVVPAANGRAAFSFNGDCLDLEEEFKFGDDSLKSLRQFKAAVFLLKHKAERLQ